VLLEPRVTTFVALRTIAEVMTYPIYLNREMRFWTIEVQHVRPNRMLASEYRLVW